MLQRELALLQTDGSRNSLPLGMTIHGLLRASQFLWIGVAWEARGCQLLPELHLQQCWDQGHKSPALGSPGRNFTAPTHLKSNR